MKATRKLLAASVLVSLVLIGGCIVGDQITTLTINPDGSADLIEIRSNLRSSETGDRGEQEIADYKTNFDARTDHDMSHVTNVGGQIVAASWIRTERPYANFVRSFLPTAAVLEKYMSESGRDDGFSLITQFHSEAAHRRLTIRITMPIDQISSLDSASDVKQLRQTYADGISESRIAVAQGTITAARGFSVASDKHSALLNLADVANTLRQGQGKTELYLEWDVTP